MKAKINTQKVEVNRTRIDYIKLGHEGVQLLIEYYNAIPATSIHKIYTKSVSLMLHRPQFVLLYIVEPPLNAQNEDPRSLFIGIFGRCSTQLLVLSYKGYFTSEFPSQLSPLFQCLACDLSFLEGFSWFLNLIDLGSTLPCKEGFLLRPRSIFVLSQKVQICCHVFSTSMAQLQYYGSAAYLIFSFIFTAKQQNIIIIHKTLFLNISFYILS